MKKFAVLLIIILSACSDDNRATNYYEKGKKAYSLQKYQEALSNFDKALEIKPNFTEVYSDRGRTKYDLEDFQGALADFNKAIEAKPSASSYHNRGLAKYSLGNLKEAMEDFNQAIQMDPNFAEPYLPRGSIKYDLKNLKEAITDFDKAIQINPNYVLPYYNRGIAKSDLKNYQEAIKDFYKALEIKPDFIEVYPELAKAKYGLRDFKGAIESDKEYAQRLGYKNGIWGLSASNNKINKAAYDAGLSSAIYSINRGAINIEESKKYLIKRGYTNFKFDNIIDNYAFYSYIDDNYETYRFALIAEKNGQYLQNSSLKGKYFALTDVKRFTTVMGQNVDTLVFTKIE
jgi:tetratricopeptide (TPR) repeat protein